MVIVWAFSYQIFIKRKFCPLCLFVQLLTLAFFIKQIMHQNLLVVDQYKVSEIVSLSFVFLLITLVLSSFVKPHFVNQSDLISAKYLLNKLKARLVKNYLEKDKNGISHNKNLHQSSLPISTTGASHESLLSLIRFVCNVESIINPLFLSKTLHQHATLNIFFYMVISCNLNLLRVFILQLRMDKILELFFLSGIRYEAKLTSKVY